MQWRFSRMHFRFFFLLVCFSYKSFQSNLQQSDDGEGSRLLRPEASIFFPLPNIYTTNYRSYLAHYHTLNLNICILIIREPAQDGLFTNLNEQV